MNLTHMYADTDLEKAKHGRWVMLIGGEQNENHDDWKQPVVIAKWVRHDDEPDGYWRFTSYDGGYYGKWENPKGFIELTDLMLFKGEIEKDDEDHIDVSSDGVAEIVHADGSREPAPENWFEHNSGFKATRIK